MTEEGVGKMHSDSLLLFSGRITAKPAVIGACGSACDSSAQAKVASARCRRNEGSRVFYEAPKTENGRNCVKFVEESVTPKEAKNVRNSPWMNKSSSFRKAPV